MQHAGRAIGLRSDVALTGTCNVEVFVWSVAGRDDNPSLDTDRLDLALAAARLGEWSWDAKTDVMTVSPREAF